MSKEVKEAREKTKVNMDPKYILKLTVTLFVTCVIVAGALGFVNRITEPNITAANVAKTQKAMMEVVADGENSEFTDKMELTQEMLDAAMGYGGTLTEVYGVKVGGEAAGYALKVNVSGSQSIIEMMVGVDTDGVVTGVSVVKAGETPKIGSKVVDNEPLPSGVRVLDQFAGKSMADGELTVGKNVDAITGATVSSKGVTAGVNAALAVAGVLG